MKGTKLGDKFLTVTPRTPKGKAKQKENSTGEKCVSLPSLSSKRRHVTEKHVLTGRKHDMRLIRTCFPVTCLRFGENDGIKIIMFFKLIIKGDGIIEILLEQSL